MDLPCVDCLILPRCVNRNLYDLWVECDQFSYFVRRSIGLTAIITCREEFKNTLIMSDGRPMLFMEYLHM